MRQPGLTGLPRPPLNASVALGYIPAIYITRYTVIFHAFIPRYHVKQHCTVLLS